MGIPGLRVLDLGDTRADDALLGWVGAHCTRLEQLDASDNAKVGDRSVAALSTNLSRSLAVLKLNRTACSAHCLDALRRMAALSILELEGTGVSATQCAQLPVSAGARLAVGRAAAALDALELRARAATEGDGVRRYSLAQLRQLRDSPFARLVPPRPLPKIAGVVRDALA
jgi:hypothetical protein